MPWQIFLGSILFGLQSTIKNPQSVEREKTVLLAIRDAINTLFPGE